MLTAILGILKFAGLFLLGILAFVLILLLIILCVPICYYLDTEYKNEEPYVFVRVSFLGPFLRFCLKYKKNFLDYHVKLFFFSLYPKKSQRTYTKKETKHKEIAQTVNPTDTDASLMPKKQDNEPLQQPIIPAPAKMQEAKGKPVSSKRKLHKKRKHGLPVIISKIKDRFHHITSQTIYIWRRFWNFKNKTALLLKLKNSETTKRTWRIIKAHIRRLWRHIRPRKICGNVACGFEDPCTTGKVLAAISVFYPLYAEHISVTPYFNEARLEVDLQIKGHIQLIYILLTAIKLYTNKYLKKTVARFQHIRGGNKYGK